MFLMCPTLAGGFFTTVTTWKVQNMYNVLKISHPLASIRQDYYSTLAVPSVTSSLIPFVHHSPYI